MAGKSSGEKRMRKLIEQFLKFGVVGTIAFCIDYGVLMLLSQAFGVDPVLSAAVSFCVSVVFNYMASMRYVFTHRADMSRSREFVAGVAVLGPSALMVTVTKLFATAVVMVWNFFSRKKWLDGGEPAGEKGQL